MTREDRRIVFDYAETFKAIFGLCEQKGMERPVAGSIIDVNFKADDDRSVVVRFAKGPEGRPVTVEYSRDFLVAALMLYCRTCHIPVPKRAMKSVELGDGGVTLQGERRGRNGREYAKCAGEKVWCGKGDLRRQRVTGAHEV
jgi:hypothetical protein